MTTQARIRSFAARIESVDDDIKARNADKKEIYAEMKGEGFDVKAFKAAHRRHLAHANNPTTAQEGEALTDIYFVALHGSEPSESQPAAKFGAANGLPESPSRAGARETTFDTPPQPVPQTLAAEQAEGLTPQFEPSADLSIPDFLQRAKKMEAA